MTKGTNADDMRSRTATAFGIRSSTTINEADQGTPNPMEGLRHAHVRTSRLRTAGPRQGRRPRWPWLPYALTLLIIAFSTVVASLLVPYLAPASLIGLYLLAVALVAATFGRGPAIVASLTSVVAFDFFLVPPRFSLAVSDEQYVLLFAGMLVVGLTIGGLASQLRKEAQAALGRERRTAALSEVSHRLASQPATRDALAAAMAYIGEVFGGQVVVLLPDDANRLVTYGSEATAEWLTPEERGIARWAYERGLTGGWSTGRLGQARGLHVPLVASGPVLGVLVLFPADRSRFLDAQESDLLRTLGNEIAVALERARLAEEAQHARVQMESERLRASLLSSISHDLRTPLAAITGSISALLEANEALDAPARRELLVSVYGEVSRLDRQVLNLLEMTRLESGRVDLRKGWYSLEELVGAVLSRPDERLQGRQLVTDLPPDLPLVYCDGALIDTVLTNLMDNALKYTPLGSPIEISACVEHGEVRVDVADRGPGLPDEALQRAFEKFYQGRPTVQGHGVGLGLSICRAIILAHGGKIWAENREGGGARFSYTLPYAGRAAGVWRRSRGRGRRRTGNN